MCLFFKTATPIYLLNTFRKQIDEGHNRSWVYDSAGDFTHTPDQWVGRAWLRPSVVLDGLLVSIHPQFQDRVTRTIYAVYHGRFQESMLAHCDNLFTEASASALAAPIDRVY